jgi:hypothetical protein
LREETKKTMKLEDYFGTQDSAGFENEREGIRADRLMGEQCVKTHILIQRFFRRSVRKEFVHQLKRMKDLDTVFSVQISANRDPASRAACNDNGSSCLPDIL